MNAWKTLCSIFLILLSFSYLSAQDYPSKNQYYLFLDAKTQDIKIIEDDSILYTNNFQHPQRLLKGEYPENLVAYEYQYSINKKNYFVNSGGGVVLEYSKDSLKRIDNSFLHRNQFAATHFQYKNEIFLFGGYGLFTDKNIITRYDFKAREWFLTSYSSEVRPINGSNYGKIVIGDHLYVFSGAKTKDVGIGSEKINPNVLWKFNIKTSVWEKLGEINLKYDINLLNSYNKSTFNLGDKIYIFDNVYSAIIDVQKNKISYYKTKFIVPNTNVIYNPKNRTINFLFQKTSTRKTELISAPLSDFFQNPIEEEAFYSTPFFSIKNISYSSFALGALLLLSLNYYRKTKRKGPLVTFTKDSIISYDKSEECFYCNGTPLHDFSTLEQSVLNFLMENIETYVPIHSINFIIEKETKIISMNTLLRKREALLHLLKSKLSIMLNISYDDIILEQKNHEDRRIKEIKLNEKYFKIIK